MKHYANALWGIVLLTTGMRWLTTALALVPAGYAIKNQATVTYQDSLGNKYTAMSNESVISVAEVYGAVLESDRSTTAAKGQTVYFCHQLTSHGNTDDRFTLSVDSKSDRPLTELKIYLDTNGDGLPSSGEPEITSGEAVSVAAGDTVNLVVAGMTSIYENVGEVMSLVVTAKPSGRPSSTISTDGLLTNTDTVTITDGAVLQVSKQVISHQPATAATQGRIIYRIQIINNGADLDSGGIYDFFPNYIKLDDLNDTDTADIRLGKIEIKSSSTLKAELPGDTSFISENNNDSGLYVGITSLQSGSSVSLEYPVSYPLTDGSLLTFAANMSMKNRVLVGYEARATAGGWNLTSESNLTEIKLPQLYGVKASNRDDSGNEAVVASAPAGSAAEFINTITNLGNGEDAFNLKVTNINFPEGTEFTLWDETGHFSLGDINGDGQPDTGLLPSSLAGAGSQLKIMVRVRIPGTAHATEVSCKATLDAVSVADSSVKGSVTEILNGITSGDIDLANYQTTTDNIVFDGQVTAITDFFQAGASTDFDPVDQVTSTISRKIGESAEFGLYIANRSEISDSFGLSFRLSDPSLQWQVTYRDNGVFDKEGNELAPPSGELITSTPLLPAETVMKVLATVELVGNISAVTASTYDIEFTASARSSGKTNSTRDAVTLLDKSLLTFTPNAEGQVEAGSFIEYQHILANNGNTLLDVAIRPPEDFVLPSGWSYLVKFGPILLVTSDVAAELFNMKPGAENILTVRITAGATLPPGSLLTLPLEARGMLAGTTEVVTSAEIFDTTRVLSPSEARITTNKTVTMVSSEGRYSNFQEVLSSPVSPGMKVAWKVTASNTSAGVAENVVIYDQAPAFTRLVSASGGGIAGNPMIGMVPATAGQVKVEGNTITFYAGEGADSTNTEHPGGSIAAGSTVEVTFEVEVEQ